MCRLSVPSIVSAVLVAWCVVGGTAPAPAAATMFAYYDLLQTRLEQTPHHAGNWYLPAPEKVYGEQDIERLTGLIKQAVWEAQASGGPVLERCAEAQKVWFEAVSSLTDARLDENGPKPFNEAPWK